MIEIGGGWVNRVRFGVCPGYVLKEEVGQNLTPSRKKGRSKKLLSRS